MFEIENTLCFTGHRLQNLICKFDENHHLAIRIKEEIRNRIINNIENNKIDSFISGMALGIDTWSAEIILDLKNNYDIYLKAAIPFIEQCGKWNSKDITRYKNILDKCDELVICQDEYSYDSLLKRNKYMVDNSSIVLAIYDNYIKGGTKQTIDYAKKKKKKIDLIDITKWY